MALDPQTEAALALHRFGFGPRAESIARIASDPRGALLAKLERSGASTIANPDLLTSAEAAQAGRDFRQVRKAAQLAERIEHASNQQAAPTAPRNNSPPGPNRKLAEMADPAQPPA